MSAEDSCECEQNNGGDSVGQQLALEDEGDAPCPDVAPADGKAPELLKAMYYWVLSRL